MKKRKFEALLLKNTLAIALPAIAVFVVLIFMFLRYPVLEKIRCNDIGNIEDVNDRIALLYDEGTTNVKYIANNLYYTGFDYFVDDKQQGAYYYSMENNQLIIFLVKTDNPVAKIEQIELKGKVIKDSMSTNHIMNQFAIQNGIDEKLLQEYCSEYIISEPDYPYAYITLIYVIFALPVVICVLIIIYTLLVWSNPVVHSQVRQLEEYGEPQEVIDELNAELTKHLIFHKNNIYITEGYMVVNYLTRTDVIKLDYIKYLSKNIVEEKRFPYRKKVLFRLTMSNPDKMFYEVDFSNEELVDDVVAYIRGINRA